jgi:hypothetical protein
VFAYAYQKAVSLVPALKSQRFRYLGFRLAKAAAEPAAKIYVRHRLSWLMLNPAPSPTRQPAATFERPLDRLRLECCRNRSPGSLLRNIALLRCQVLEQTLRFSGEVHAEIPPSYRHSVAGPTGPRAGPGRENVSETNAPIHDPIAANTT